MTSRIHVEETGRWHSDRALFVDQKILIKDSFPYCSPPYVWLHFSYLIIYSALLSVHSLDKLRLEALPVANTTLF